MLGCMPWGIGIGGGGKEGKGREDPDDALVGGLYCSTMDGGTGRPRWSRYISWYWTECQRLYLFQA